MRALCLLALVVCLQAQNSSNSTQCTPITAPPEIVYHPVVYQETSRVSQLSGYTSLDFCTELVSNYEACSAYSKQLIAMVAVPIVLTVIIIISLTFFLCCRSERCCSCRLPFPKLWMTKALLGALLFASFVAIYASFAGSTDFKEGASNLGRAISNIEATVANVNTQLAAGLQGCNELRNGSTGVATGSCNGVNPLVDAQVRSNGQDILDQIPNVEDPIHSVLTELNFTGKLDEIRAAIVDNSERNIDRAFYAIIGIYTLALLFGVLGITCSAVLLNAELCLGSINVIIAGIFIGIELGFSVGVSDFCHPNPRAQILSLVSAAGSPPEALEALKYMMSCEGFNPVKNKSDDIVRGMTALQSKVCVFSNYSSPNPQCSVDLGNATRGLTDLVNSSHLFFNTIASCKFFNEPLVLLTDDAVCTNMVDGLYAMWTSQMVATIFLILALFVTPCVKERIRKDKENPIAEAKQRSSVTVQYNAQPAAVAAPVAYVAAPAAYVAAPMPVYAPPPEAEGKYDEAPPTYSPVDAPGTDVEMNEIPRDKLGDPVYMG